MRKPGDLPCRLLVWDVVQRKALRAPQASDQKTEGRGGARRAWGQQAEGAGSLNTRRCQVCQPEAHQSPRCERYTKQAQEGGGAKHGPADRDCRAAEETEEQQHGVTETLAFSGWPWISQDGPGFHLLPFLLSLGTCPGLHL